MQALALQAVSDSFPTDVHALCGCLLTYGPLTLGEVLQQIRLDGGDVTSPCPYSSGSNDISKTTAMDRVMQALAQGLHYGIIGYTRSEMPGRPRGGTIRYEFVESVALRLFGLPKYVAHISSLFGPVAGSVAEIVGTSGRLAEGEIIPACIAAGHADSAVKSSFQLLCRRGYLEQAEVPTGGNGDDAVPSNTTQSSLSSAVKPTEVPMWQLSHRRCRMDILDAAIVKHCQDKFGDAAGTIVQFMLTLGCATATRDRTRPVAIAEICTHEAIMKQRLNVTNVHRVLLDLASTSVPIVTLNASSSRVEDLQYSVNVEATLESLRMESSIAYVLHKFGRYHARIIRLLRDKKALDEKSIGDLLMIPPKDTRQYLFKLHQSQLLRLEEFCSKGDYNFQATHYVWHFDAASFVTATKTMICRAMLNVSIRLADARRKAVSGSAFTTSALGSTEREKRITAMCMSTIMQLYDLLELFLS